MEIIRLFGKKFYTCPESNFESIEYLITLYERWYFPEILQDFRLKKEFNKLYKCKNYKNKKYNLSRNKHLWMENLIEE